jgi:hypothetical protein
MNNLVYAVPVYLPDGTHETVYISEGYYNEEKLDRGTNLESYIIDLVYNGQLVNVGYPVLVDERERV